MNASEWSGDDLVGALVAGVEPPFAGGVAVVTSPPTRGLDLVPSAVERLRTTPSVVVCAPGVDTVPQLLDLVDTVLTTAQELDDVVDAASRTPIAAQATATLLRVGDQLPSSAGLVLESAVFSSLQAGPEHRAWLERRSGAHRQDRSTPRVRVQREANVLDIELCRVAAANAVDAQMRDELLDALAILEVDPQLHAVLHAAGPVFCAGGDLYEFGTTPDPATAHLVRLRRSLAAVLERVSPRMTARVHGAAVGAGLELAAFASQLIAHPDTTFSLPELGLGLVPGAGGTVSVVRRIGRHRTAWMLLTGRAVDSPTAASWGLVDAVEVF